MVHALILHVTLLLILAFFILFAASKAEGLVALFGNVLGIWVIAVAVLHIVGYFMPGMMGMHGEGVMHDQWMHHWGGQPAPAPATPNKP